MMKWLLKFNNGEHTYWKKVIKAKCEEEDNWMTKEVTTAYGVSVWRSIRSLCSEFKANTQMKVRNGEKTEFWKDVWHEVGKLEALYPDIYYLQKKTIVDHWTPQGWNFIFRRQLNDWEIQRVADFFNTIGQFNGLEGDRDILLWKGNRKGNFKVGYAYNWLNHTNQPQSNWPWRGIWKSKIPLKVACFVWLLAKEYVLTQDNLKKGDTIMF